MGLSKSNCKLLQTEIFYVFIFFFNMSIILITFYIYCSFVVFIWFLYCFQHPLSDLLFTVKFERITLNGEHKICCLMIFSIAACFTILQHIHIFPRNYIIVYTYMLNRITLKVFSYIAQLTPLVGMCLCALAIFVESAFYL